MPALKPNKSLFSVAEVAKLLHVSRIAVHKQIKSGRLPAEKVGRNYVVARADVEVAMGISVSPQRKEEIRRVVKKAVHEYKAAFQRLGKEEE